MSFADSTGEKNKVLDGDQVRRDLQAIALAEITRHRSILGSLTEEQQSAVEELLISTTDQISGRLIQRIQKYPSDLRNRYLNLWNSQLAQ